MRPSAPTLTLPCPLELCAGDNVNSMVSQCRCCEVSGDRLVCLRWWTLVCDVLTRPHVDRSLYCAGRSLLSRPRRSVHRQRRQRPLSRARCVRQEPAGRRRSCGGRRRGGGGAQAPGGRRRLRRAACARPHTTCDRGACEPAAPPCRLARWKLVEHILGYEMLTCALLLASSVQGGKK
jgi:hypothetical protein